GTEGRAHHFSTNRDRITPLDGQHHHRRAGHELHEARIKWLAAVRLIMRLGQLCRNLHELHADDLQSLVFKASEDLADESALNGIGFKNDERAFHNLKFLFKLYM